MVTLKKSLFHPLLIPRPVSVFFSFSKLHLKQDQKALGAEWFAQNAKLSVSFSCPKPVWSFRWTSGWSPQSWGWCLTSACSSCRFNLKSSLLSKDAPRTPDLFMVAPGTHPHTACFWLSHHQAFGRAVPLRRRSTCSSPEAEVGPILQEALSKPSDCHSATLCPALVHAYTFVLLASHDVPTTHIPLGLLH